jgi:hypothetical protein
MHCIVVAVCEEVGPEVVGGTTAFQFGQIVVSKLWILTGIGWLGVCLGFDCRALLLAARLNEKFIIGPLIQRRRGVDAGRQRVCYLTVWGALGLSE